MGTFLAVVAGGFAAIFGAASKAEQLKAEKEQQLASYESQATKLTDEYAQNTAENEMAGRHALESLTQANKTLNGQISNAQADQSTTQKQNASSARQQDAIANQEIAALQVDAEQAEGAAVQKVGMSGFRLSGSGSNAIRDQQSTNKETLDKANAQATLNRYSNISQAHNTYVSYDEKIQNYEAQKESAKLSYQQTTEELQLRQKNLDTNYNRDYGETQANIAYLNSDEYNNTVNWAIGSSFISGMSNINWAAMDA